MTSAVVQRQILPGDLMDALSRELRMHSAGMRRVESSLMLDPWRLRGMGQAERARIVHRAMLDMRDQLAERVFPVPDPQQVLAALERDRLEAMNAHPLTVRMREVAMLELPKPLLLAADAAAGLAAKPQAQAQVLGVAAEDLQAGAAVAVKPVVAADMSNATDSTAWAAIESSYLNGSTLQITAQAVTVPITVKYMVNNLTVGATGMGVAGGGTSAAIYDWSDTAYWKHYYFNGADDHWCRTDRPPAPKAPEEKFVRLRLVDGLPRIGLSGRRRYGLPNGAVLHVSQGGDVRVEDRDAKVVYEAASRREFNPYVNASDVLAEFVKYAGGLGVRRSEFLGLPIGLFVNWLVVTAAEKDKEPVPEDVRPLPELVARHRLAQRGARCTCGRFVRRALADGGFRYCGPGCAERHYRRLSTAEPARLVARGGTKALVKAVA